METLCRRIISKEVEKHKIKILLEIANYEIRRKYAENVVKAVNDRDANIVIDANSATRSGEQQGSRI